MRQLLNQTKSTVISQQVDLADNFWSRNRGLIGTDSLNGDQCLWILRCPWIHTYFMSFALDALFVDKNLKVKKIVYNLKPWRFSPLALGAYSVFEFQAGNLKQVDVGDQLNVVG